MLPLCSIARPPLRPLLLGAVLLAGCSNLDRSLIFATHTTQGLELSVGAPQSGGSPVQIVLGYKRFEGVINPVYDAKGIEGCGSSKYRDEAYSVIAKFQGEIEANVGAGGTAGTTTGGALVTSQWFATGEAATLLAQSTGTVAALSDNPEVAKALGRGDVLARRTLRRLMVNQVRQLVHFLREAAATDPEAQGHLDALDGLGALLPAKFPFDHYSSFDALGDPAIERVQLAGTAVDATGIDRVLDYWDRLSESHANLERIVTARATNQVSLQDKGPDGTVLATAMPALSDPVFARDHALQAGLLASFEERLFAAPAFVEAQRHVVDVIAGEAGIAATGP